MPNTDPFPSNSVFPIGKDTFPSLVDFGSTDALAVPRTYTKLWASHYNKIVNCITSIESELSKTKFSAISDSSLSGISYVLRLPPVNLANVFANGTPLLSLQGLFPPTHIYPFEWVVTSSTDDYSKMPIGPGAPNVSRMYFYETQENMNTIFGGLNLYNIHPIVSVTLTRRHLGYVSGFSTMKWLVNSYVEVGDDTLLIKGCIIDPYLTSYSTTSLEAVGYRFDPSVQINCSIIGVRT